MANKANKVTAKFADCTALVGEIDFREDVTTLEKSRKTGLNVGKTKAIIVDQRKGGGVTPLPVIINNSVVEKGG